MRRKGTDTRAEIQDVALALFTEHGYDATSMREIAERLDITKAALYYHFKSKEAIILSLFEEHLSAFDELLAWAAAQPHSPQLSSKLLGGWLALSTGRGLPIMRFAAANQTALRTVLPADQGTVQQRLEKATQIISGPDAPLQERLRVRMALLSVHITVMASHETEAGDADILAAATHAAALLTGDLFPAPQLPLTERCGSTGMWPETTGDQRCS
ncbi:TetR/AcrR family transcriptional regulator [Streptosporangium lutulentum]|uniref:AcrR family transcriptional regulator n=1 Tax=Streptosporangium lutulentum TaxID=1461250 RepID=A0ABT9QHL4_9ACTN|nr:TetR/AcrR family transcriptional regulator [Streptosporangium lutulentum]MDP9846250.1 AcrR family transcriptional regulator [Streptosporangium lutulentum]